MIWFIIGLAIGFAVGAFGSIAYMEEHYDVYEKEEK